MWDKRWRSRPESAKSVKKFWIGETKLRPLQDVFRS